MAEKRMYSKKIIETDEFLSLPLSTQALYFHLGMNADDDGFVSSPMKVMRMIGANKNELDLLLVKRYLIPFENGVVVIRHWRINNYLRSDRYNPTIYLEQKEQLFQEENGSYELKSNSGIPMVDQVDTQYRIDKSRLDKNNILCENEDDLFLDVEVESGSMITAESQIFDFWNECNIIKHRDMTDNIKKTITKALKTYTREDICKYIKRYAIVLEDDKYFFNYKWTLIDFLNRKDGISSFSDEGSKWVNFVNATGYTEREEVVEEASYEDKESF